MGNRSRARDRGRRARRPAGLAIATATALALLAAGPAPGAPASTSTPSPGPSVAAGARGTADPLSANGLASALCASGRLHAGLSATARANCASSGLAFAAAPVDHYGFDTHIDTGLSPLAVSNQMAVVQNLFMTPVWTALVWVTHALVVALEWSYSLDLLDRGTLGPIASALRSARGAFSDPWLAAVLAVAGVLAAYRGLIQRRVADGVADVMSTLAMILAGLWLIADPVGTIGAASRLVNDAALGTLAAVSSGRPSAAVGTFGESLRGVFDTSVTGPWCYLEFGSVGWCERPAAMDGRLKAAALRLAGAAGPPAACRSGGDFATCAALSQRGPQELTRERDLIRRARSNGDLFLAFPAGGPERNALSTDSLLRTLCGATDATACRGPTAPQARFRTEAGTWSRAGGLLFIALGMAGMFAVLAFVIARLLGAALLTAVYLLLAPAAVLSPALGDWGRGVFRAWATRLVGALCAKLVYSVLLGALLLMVRVLTTLGAVGWWIQWILIAVFWWMVFNHRHRLLEGPPSALARGRPGTAPVSGRIHARHLRRGAQLSGRLAVGAGRMLADGARNRQAPGAGRLRPPSAPAATPGAVDGAEREHERERLARAEHLLEGRHRAAGELAAGPDPPTRSEQPGARPSWDGAQRERLAREEALALAGGDRRRAVSLRQRAQRRDLEQRGQEEALRAAAVTAREGEHHHRRTGLVYDPAARTAALGELDAQAALRRGISPGPRQPPELYRDYGRLATLAGLTPVAYAALGPAERRRARVAVDRELDRHRPSAADSPPDGAAAAPGRGRSLVPRILGAARRAPPRRVIESPRQRRARQLLGSNGPPE